MKLNKVFFYYVGIIAITILILIFTFDIFKNLFNDPIDEYSIKQKIETIDTEIDEAYYIDTKIYHNTERWPVSSSQLFFKNEDIHILDSLMNVEYLKAERKINFLIDIEEIQNNVKEGRKNKKISGS